MKHTHTGTCPACGRQQAVNVKTDRLSAHGYTIKYGWQMGTCGGARELPAELSDEFARLIQIPAQLAKAAELEAKTLDDVKHVLLQIGPRNDRKTVLVSSEEEYRVHCPSPMHHASYADKRASTLAGWHREAKERRAYAAAMDETATRCLGKPLTAVAADTIEKVSKWFARRDHDGMRAYVLELETAGYKVRSVRDRNYGSGYTIYGTRAA
jgi:hypothetical protein